MSSKSGPWSSSSFLNHFQRCGLTITEKSPAVSILPLPVFSYFSPIFLSHFYILSNLVYPSGLGSFSLNFLCSIFLGVFSSLLYVCVSYKLSSEFNFYLFDKKILRREECDSYLTHVCRHHHSGENLVKR